MADPWSADRLQQWKQAFNRLDVDNSGVITADNLRHVVGTMGQQGVDVNEMIRMADYKNTGHIDFPEFLTFMTSRGQGGGAPGGPPGMPQGGGYPGMPGGGGGGDVHAQLQLERERQRTLQMQMQLQQQQGGGGFGGGGFGGGMPGGYGAPPAWGGGFGGGGFGGGYY